MGFELPYLVSYVQGQSDICVPYAVALYITTWRHIRQPARAPLICFSALWIAQQACDTYKKTFQDGFTMMEIMEIIHTKGVVSEAAFSIGKNDHLDFFVPPWKGLVKSQSTMERAIRDGGFVFGIELKPGSKGHCLYAYGYDETGVKVQTSEETMNRFCLSWKIMLSSQTHSLTVFYE